MLVTGVKPGGFGHVLTATKRRRGSIACEGRRVARGPARFKGALLLVDYLGVPMPRAAKGGAGRDGMQVVGVVRGGAVGVVCEVVCAPVSVQTFVGPVAFNGTVEDLIHLVPAQKEVNSDRPSRVVVWLRAYLFECVRVLWMREWMCAGRRVSCDCVKLRMIASLCVCARERARHTDDAGESTTVRWV